MVQYTRNTRSKLKRFFAFSNTPVGGIGNVHKKIETIVDWTLKIRFFDEKCVAFGSVDVTMGEDLMEILVLFSF